MASARESIALYQTLVSKLQKIADIQNAAAVLHWDEETYLPEKGTGFRGQQLATLSTMAHGLFTEETLGELLQKLKDAAGLNPIQEGNVRRTLEDYEKNKKYSSEFVRELSMTASESYHAWIKARKENNYDLFQPALKKMVALKQQEADLLGYQDHPYNALLNDYEKGATVRMLDTLFDRVKKELKPFLEALQEKPEIKNDFLHQQFDKDRQWKFGLALLHKMGFDFEAGRQDLSEHPFTTSFNSKDVRITTRIDEKDFGNMTWSCIHEGGHALYEQGLPEEQYGLPAGEAASLAIHESQSRLWENNVGRSLNFWKHFYPELKKQFKQPLAAISLTDFYKGINKVEPSLIRTESDELTYHFHIMIRYELEKKLISGELKTTDLRQAWNEGYQDYLHIQIPDDRSGILQDIHWSHGSFGYFPTYSLGSFYAAQFYKTAQNQLPDLEKQISEGNLAGLLDWLRTNIHPYGRLYLSEELCKKVTGQPLNFDFFMAYARKKFGGIYRL